MTGRSRIDAAARRQAGAVLEAGTAPPPGGAAGTAAGALTPVVGLVGSPRRRRAMGGLAITGLVCASYYPALWGGFVWDDVIFSEEPVIHALSGLWSIWASPADIRNEGHYWPLVYTTFWLEHKLWGLAAPGYHAVNVALHAVNSLLVWHLAGRLAVPGAWLLGAVFAVHPLHVESVAWIIERKDLLSALFYLGAVLAWLRFDETARAGAYAAALGLFVAAMLSKSIAVTLPAALLVLAWWRRGTLRAGDLVRVAPFLAVGLGIAWADYLYYASRESVDLGYSLAERALVAARALWFYAGKLAWPADLAVIYPLWRIDVGSVLAWGFLLAAAALAGALWFLRARLGRGPLAGALFFAATLAPVLGFVDYGYMQFSLVADRFQYLAGLGLLAVAVAAGCAGAGRLPPFGRAVAGVVAAAVLAGLATLTWRQSGVYRDEIALFGHIVALNPVARDAHLNLGSALLEAGRVEDGLAASLIAAEQRPDTAGPLANLGRAYLAQRRFDEAEATLERAIELEPRNLTALQNLAESHRRRNRVDQAEAGYRAVLEIDGDYALAHAGLGHMLAEAGRHDEALGHMERALALQPYLDIAAALHVRMARSLLALGRDDDKAARALLRAAELRPRSVEPLLELAALHDAAGRPRQAARYRRSARDVVGRHPAGLHAVAESLRKSERPEDAVAVYREALAADADFAPAHAGLGLALYQLDDHSGALAAMARALELDAALPVAASLRVFSGHALRDLGDSDAAHREYAAALVVDPRNAEALDNLAMARFGQERYEEALGLYLTLADVNPSSAVTQSNLGAVLHRLGRHEEALERIEAALVLDPELELARVGRTAVRKALGVDAETGGAP